MRNPVGVLSISFVLAVGFSVGAAAEKGPSRGVVGSRAGARRPT